MSVVACPKCSEEVTIPPDAPREAKVRCPLCAEVYLLGEALITLPPMLEIVEMPEGYRPRSRVEEPSYAAAGMRESDDFSRAAFGSSLAEEDTDQSELGIAGADTFSEPAAAGIGEAQVRRQPLHPPGSRKKKRSASPIGSLIAVMLGGVMAIPCALLLLLWLPGDLAKDPMKLGPWLTENAPYLIPEAIQAKHRGGMKKPSTPNVSSASTEPGAPEQPTDPSQVTVAEKKPAAEGGLDFGNKFENALKGSNETVTPEFKPTPEEVATNNPELPKLPGLADPLMPEKLTPSPEPEVKPELNPLPAANGEEVLTTARAELATTSQAFDAAVESKDRDAIRQAMSPLYAAGAKIASALPVPASGAGSEFGVFLNDSIKLRGTVLLALAAMDADTREHDGIILTGTIKSCRAGLELSEIVVELPTKDKRTLVVIGPEMPEGSTVFIAGKIVDDPAKLLPDISRTDKRAVQVSFFQELPK